MSDRVLGAVCVVASAAMAWAAQDYAAAISYEPVGPRAFPLLLAAGLGLSGLWLVLRPTAGTEAFHGVPWKPTAGCAAAVLAYALLFQWLGFPLATALMAVVSSYTEERAIWITLRCVSIYEFNREGERRQ